MPISLPPDADLEWLRGAAKTLRKRVHRGDDEALALVQAHHPRYAASPDPPPTFTLSDAHLTIARAHGFASWPRLVEHLARVAPLSRSPHRAPALGTDGDTLLRLGCLTYGDGQAPNAARGNALLARRPDLSAASPFTAAATGDHAALAAMLAADVGAVSREGGPFGWPPLLYLTYSRLEGGGIPGLDPVAAARVLLNGGADPNAGFLWSGLVPPFTAVTGVIGRGEQGAPAHREQAALLSLLLEAGADANDGQAAYNCGLGNARPSDDTEWLELLLSHGLGRPSTGPWYARLGSALADPGAIVGELLQDAAGRGLAARVRVLLAAGADPGRGGDHPLQRGRSPYVDAVEHGFLEIAHLLESAGADTSGVDAGRRTAGTALAGSSLTEDELRLARRARPDLVRLAVELGKPKELVSRLVAQGWDVDAVGNATALHEAALRGDADLVRTLLDLGADATITDPVHGATAAGWAAHAGHTAVQRLLEGRD